MKPLIGSLPHPLRRIQRRAVAVGLILLAFAVVAEISATDVHPPAEPSVERPMGAWLTIPADDRFRVLVEGREIGGGTNRTIGLPIGPHVVTVESLTFSSNSSSEVRLDPQLGVGAWIWARATSDKQFCRLWRSFVIPAGAKVERALLEITADNGFRVMLDGREIGQGSDWRSISEYDLTWLLGPGAHVLAIEAFNDSKEAGVLAGLRVELSGDRPIEIPSDATWRVAPPNERGWEHKRQAPPHWPKAVVVGQFKGTPWGTAPVGVTRVPPLSPIQLRFWHSGWFQVFLLTLCVTALLACIRLMARVAMHSQAQRLLARERARIARDIHDELGAGLTQLLLLGEVTRKEGTSEPKALAGIERLCSRARGLSKTLDEIVWTVNSRHDTLKDFARHTCKYAQTFFADTPIRCRLEVDSELPELPFDLPTRRNLFLSVKEALNNAAKHSGAKEIFLHIHLRGADVVVTVADDGKGFDPESVSGERNGLTNLRQRMAEIGGKCQVESRPGAGCRVALRVPLSPSRGGIAKWFRPRIKQTTGLGKASGRGAPAGSTIENR